MSTLKTIAVRHLNGSSDNISLDANGRVGIGTSSPATSFHIKTTSAVAARFETDGAYNYLQFANTTTQEVGWIGYGSSNQNNFGIYNTRPGEMTFGINGQTRMTIDSSGRVTKPYTPLVCASFNSNANWLNYNNNPTTVIFNDASLMNNGGYYNTSTGIFTCPVTGLYRVSSGALMGNASYAFIYMYKNSTNVGHVVHHNPASGTGYMTCGGEWMVSCSANDTLKIGWATGNGGGIYGGGYNYFNVELIG